MAIIQDLVVLGRQRPSLQAALSLLLSVVIVFYLSARPRLKASRIGKTPWLFGVSSLIIFSNFQIHRRDVLLQCSWS